MVPSLDLDKCLGPTKSSYSEIVLTQAKSSSRPLSRRKRVLHVAHSARLPTSETSLNISIRLAEFILACYYGTLWLHLTKGRKAFWLHGLLSERFFKGYVMTAPWHAAPRLLWGRYGTLLKSRLCPPREEGDPCLETCLDDGSLEPLDGFFYWVEHRVGAELTYFLAYIFLIYIESDSFISHCRHRDMVCDRHHWHSRSNPNFMCCCNGSMFRRLSNDV